MTAIQLENLDKNIGKLRILPWRNRCPKPTPQYAYKGDHYVYVIELWIPSQRDRVELEKLLNYCSFALRPFFDILNRVP